MNIYMIDIGKPEENPEVTIIPEYSPLPEVLPIPSSPAPEPGPVIPARPEKVPA
jgi:hypothetical protein